MKWPLSFPSARLRILETSEGFLADRYWKPACGRHSSKIFLAVVVFPVPDWPSIITGLPGVRISTRISLKLGGRTKVNSGIPSVRKTSSTRYFIGLSLPQSDPDFFHHIQPVCAITDIQPAECNNIFLTGRGISMFVLQTQVRLRKR